MPKAWFWERDEVRVVGEYIQPGAQSSITLVISWIDQGIKLWEYKLYLHLAFCLKNNNNIERLQTLKSLASISLEASLQYPSRLIPPQCFTAPSTQSPTLPSYQIKASVTVISKYTCLAFETSTTTAAIGQGSISPHDMRQIWLPPNNFS